MKLRVKQGSVKYDDSVYTEGQTFDIGDVQGKSLLDAGIVEEVQEVAPEPKEKPKKVKEEKPKEEPAKEEPAEKIVEAEPSLDWTRKELVAHAEGLGIEEPDRLGAKEKILEAIQAKEVKSE